jgi:hypothetical protein
MKVNPATFRSETEGVLTSQLAAARQDDPWCDGLNQARVSDTP